MKLIDPSLEKLKVGDRVGPFLVKQVGGLDTYSYPVRLIEGGLDPYHSWWPAKSTTAALIEAFGIEREEKWEPTGRVFCDTSIDATTNFFTASKNQTGTLRYIEERLVNE